MAVVMWRTLHQMMRLTRGVLAIVTYCYCLSVHLFLNKKETVAMTQSNL